MNVGLGHNNVQRTVHWRGSARQLRLYLGPWPHRSLTLAPWSPHHIGTDWGHWPRLTTRPARGLGPASRTPGHVCRLIYVIFITSKCHHAKSQLSHRIHFQSTVELQYLRLYDELMSYCLISVQRLKILCLSLCLSPVSVCDWVFSRFRFGPSGCRQLPAKMMDGLQFTCTGTGSTAQVSSMIYWYQCR